MPYIGRAPSASITKLEDADQDTKIQVEESSDEDTIRFDIAGAEDFTMTANTLTALSGSTIKTNTIAETTGASGVTVDGMIIKDGGLTIASGKTLAVASGGAITNSGTATGFGMDSESAYAGVLETNATFVDQAIFGPSVDGKSWNGKWSVASLYSSLMLVTIEDAGADTQVNIWDLTEVSSSAPSTTPLGTVTITGAATPTSVAAAMGYIIVGSEDGISIIDPHSGSWAERTVGWPRTLSTSTTPALAANTVNYVAAGTARQPAFDPRTGGPMPTFVVSYSGDSKASSIIKEDGTVFDRAGTGNVAGISNGDAYVNLGNTLYQVGPIDAITADAYQHSQINRVDSAPFGLMCDTAFSIYDGTAASADADGLTFHKINLRNVNGDTNDVMNAIVTRAYNSGFYTKDIRGLWLANSKTVDRSYKANTLTETGTVTEAAVESGAELNGYSGWSTSNYLSRASDADWDVLGTGDAMISCWMKASTVSGNESLFGISATDSNPWIGFYHSTTEVVFSVIGASANVGVAYPERIDDGEWHHLLMTRSSSEDVWYGYLDGALVAQTASAAGSISDSGNLRLAVGIRASDVTSEPATNSTIALCKISATHASATQVRQMYDAEKGMFVASAECLLQSGSTDAVLDVDVDPLSSKVLVTQTDAITIFDGLAVDSKPTVNSGLSEKGKLWGDLRAEQNDANVYVTAPAVDQRQVNEMVRGLASELPAGVDLSKAKAWCIYDGTGTANIMASYNIKSITDNGTGDTTFTFAIPFKGGDDSATDKPSYSVAMSSMGISTYPSEAQSTYVRIIAKDTSFNAYDSAMVSIVCFGELENE